LDNKSSLVGDIYLMIRKQLRMYYGSGTVAPITSQWRHTRSVG